MTTEHPCNCFGLYDTDDHYTQGFCHACGRRRAWSIKRLGTHTSLPQADGDDGNLSQAQIEALTGFQAHIQNCEMCLPHIGHIPLGLCHVGRALFFGMGE